MIVSTRLARDPESTLLSPTSPAYHNTSTPFHFFLVDGIYIEMWLHKNVEKYHNIKYRQNILITFF